LVEVFGLAETDRSGWRMAGKNLLLYNFYKLPFIPPCPGAVFAYLGVNNHGRVQQLFLVFFITTFDTNHLGSTPECVWFQDGASTDLASPHRPEADDRGTQKNARNTKNEFRSFHQKDRIMP